MEALEVAKLLQKIDSFYPGRLKLEDPKPVIAAWHEILRDSDFEKSNAKLNEYVKHNKYPPTVSDLVAEGFKKTPEQIEHERMIAEMKKGMRS